jgi:FkbM family methyltransferase
VGFHDALLNRVVARLDKPTQAKLHWRARLRADSLHARLMRELVAPGDTAVDIGANWGLYTIGLSSLVGRHGHVAAFEPGPALHALRAACRRSANVEIYALALSDRNGTARMEVPIVSDSPASALAYIVEPAPGDQSSVEIALARLDDLEIVQRARLRFVKCDVEGHEDAVLRGGEQSIRESMPALLVELEERHRQRPVSDAFELLESWGYVGCALTANGLAPLGQFDLDRDQRAHLVGGELPIPTPPGYVNDFVFTEPREWSRASGAS